MNIAEKEHIKTKKKKTKRKQNTAVNIRMNTYRKS